MRPGLERLWVNLVCGSAAVPARLRLRLMRRAGLSLGSVEIAAGCLISGGPDLTVGDGTFINASAYLDTVGGICIGARVRIGPRITIHTSGHELGGPVQRAGDVIPLPVRIGDGCWIGGNVTVLPGVDIAPGCVIGAGAVVAASTQADGLYVGVPARRVRDLD